MRLIYLIAVLFSACGTQTSTQPRVVEMPELPAQYTKSLPPNCTWDSAKVEVFNQSSQSISFRYQNCSADPRNKQEFFFKDSEMGGIIFARYFYNSSRKVEVIQKTELGSANLKPIKKWKETKQFRLWKQGPSTPADFFGQLMGDDYSCELYPYGDNQYIVVKSDFRNKEDFQIIPDEPAAEFLARYNMYSAINKYDWTHINACSGLTKNLIVFNEGLVYALPTSQGSSIDFQSITYTNKG